MSFNNIIKRIIPYLIAFFGGSISAILMLMGRYTRPEMVRELIFYAQRGEVIEYLFMFIVLNGIMIIVLIFGFIFLSIKKKKKQTQEVEK